MHELSLCAGVVRIVSDEAAAAGCARVCAVVLDVGALANVDMDALRFGFIAASRGTVAENATLTIDVVPARATCVRCGGHAIVHERVADCPMCGAPLLARSGGDHLIVRRIEVE